LPRKPVKIALGFILSLILVCLAGTLVPRPFGFTRTGSEAASHRILVLRNPIHTDIAIPIDAAARREFGFVTAAGLDLDTPGARYLVFGWGGRSFYTETPTWADLKFMPALRGLTIDASVMHVELAGDIRLDSPNVTALEIGDAGRDNLLKFIRASFSGGAGAPISLPGFAYGEYDAFFEATGYFSAILGCNTWTAAALRQAGISTGWWTPLPDALLWSIRLHN
jgi:uncharacterized protein (TIGR02117 family)